jgi:Arc/MetJ family transcription regulator
LSCMHNICIIVCMRTTLNLDAELLEEAQRLSGLTGKTAVIHAGLRALIARESARRLAALGGSEKALEPIRRRRPGKGA